MVTSSSGNDASSNRVIPASSDGVSSDVTSSGVTSSDDAEYVYTSRGGYASSNRLTSLVVVNSVVIITSVITTDTITVAYITQMPLASLPILMPSPVAT